MKIKESIKKRQLSFLRIAANDAFEEAVYHCSKVTTNNSNLAFAIYKSVCGYPRIEIIDKPDIVRLTEVSNCVVVKNGKKYKMNVV